MINLHVHSKYSWDCISSIKDIVQTAVEYEQNAIAVTDHGLMSGAMELFLEAQKAGIKPIIGCEFYVCPPGIKKEDKNAESRRLNHLVVLAKNLVGYKNLIKLNYIANENFYYRPRIDEQALFENSEGLIVINGHFDTSVHDCLFFNREMASVAATEEECELYIHPEYEDNVLQIVSRYQEFFGEDFYLECQMFDQKDPIQQVASKKLFEISQKYKINAVGTGDAHYVKQEDAIFHKTFCAIKQNKKVKDLPSISYYTNGSYSIVSNEHAEKTYPAELIEATHEIASKIEDFDITIPIAVPSFSSEGKLKPKEVVRDKCIKKLKKLNLYNEEYIKRLDYEISILELGNLYDYFLVVEDYCEFARKQSMLIGPGRGSSGGCLISYLLDIVSINPLEYDLSFDRFFSAEKARSGSIPDIDTDFQSSRRDEIIDYVQKKYGKRKVCEVVTYGKLQAKNALKDVLRAHAACTPMVANKITKNIPDKDKISDKLKDFFEETGSSSVLYYCLKKEPKLLSDYCRISTKDDGTEVFEGDYAESFRVAIGLEGAIKSSSRHPSALIISPYDIDEICPMLLDKKTNQMITAYDMYYFPYASLVKFDILVLKSLDCLAEVNTLLKETGL